MLYWLRQLAALAGASVMTPASRQCVVFWSAGAIWSLLKPPSPQSAKPSFFLEAAASARVTRVLMKGAAATAAACAMNSRRSVMFRTSCLASAQCALGCQEVQHHDGRTANV